MPSKAHSYSWLEAVPGMVVGTLCLLAWWCLWRWLRSPEAHVLMHGSAAPTMMYSRPAQFALLFIGSWTLMTMAMMLPTSIPLLVLFQRMVRGRATAPLLGIFVVVGYLTTWALMGIILQLVNWMLQASVRRLVPPTAVMWVAAAAVLSIAGLFQFSNVKRACLERCRSPLSFLITRWRGGNELLQALQLGLQHGLFCAGCCWALMLLMFVVGVGSLTGMLGLGVLMAVEKNFRWGARLSVPLGVLLLASAAAALLAGLLV